ncbi:MULTISPECIES: ABC transporter permease [Microbacterium]|uniref:ABC transporter permease n=2 Tax=Microbacterium maritypicum TaxID=33918 RepID=A0AAJ5V9W6_MICMQ|nr:MULTISPECIES: ABC transporter permease [Microbacterium]EYT61432.1 spermidine/putrescine ABC transporter permease [Microbacterium sp. UCD-TDU]KQV01949.1 spermidine/putrescine ABC transporter permease [Microbacterium sp. Root322]MBP5801347.1 ABC transporter permease [Microbacterium liquefaciens]UTT52052.1 ABC transporter permease [Microbacterium liquefaciens]WEF20053.1 ABC transporter permease [Microbacterium liquefaciens]
MPKLKFGLAIPAWAWLLIFFVAPIFMVVVFSFGYKPSIFATHALDHLSFDRYLEALSPTFFSTFLNTLWIGILGTALCLVIGGPVAYWIAVKAPPSKRGLLLALVMVPFWTNFLVRTIGWQVILAPEGWLSQLLQGIGVIPGPLDLLYSRGAVLLGVVYNYLPLMILPLFVAFDRVSGPLREASKDLGANSITTFLRVTVPLARPGIIAGVLLVYIPLMGDYITATVLGGAKGNMIGQVVASQFQTAQNWALGSAMAVLLIIVIMISIAVAAGLLWLVTLPLRQRHRLVLGEGS